MGTEKLSRLKASPLYSSAPNIRVVISMRKGLEEIRMYERDVLGKSGPAKDSSAGY